MSKVAIYIRVSTMMQADRDSLPMQRKDLVNYSELILKTTSHEVFEDAGFSAKSTDRPAFQAMMERIRKREFTHLLVWKLDRISRNLLDFASMYEELKALQVTFVSLNEQFDTSSAMGEAMLKIILVFAELERKITAERVTATMISRASAGKWNGGKAPYGYTYKDGVFALDPEESDACRLMIEKYLSCKAISPTVKYMNQLGIKGRDGHGWSHTKVHRILCGPFYRGTLTYNVQSKPVSDQVAVQNHHPAIVTPEIASKIDAILDNNKDFPRNGTKTRSPFRRLVYCGVCGSAMYVHPSPPGKDGFSPTRFFCPNFYAKNNCDNPGLNEVKIGSVVINAVNAVLCADACISSMDTPKALERFMRFLVTEPAHIGGIEELYAYLIGRSGASASYAPDPPSPSLPIPDTREDELERQQRALDRLQDLYLYSDKSMSRSEYMQRREAILAKIAELNVEKVDAEKDKDLFYMASNLLLSSILGKEERIDYRSISKAVDPDVLNDYFKHVLKEITVVGGKVVSITFHNGLSLTFDYPAR